MSTGLYALRGVEMAHERTGPVTRGSDLLSDYKLAFFYLLHQETTKNMCYIRILFFKD